MKPPRIFLTVLLALGFAFPVPAPRGPVHLVRIAKGAPNLETLFRTWGLDVAQELGTCYLARLDREETARLRSAGVPVTPIDRDVSGKAYYLVRRDSDRTPALLAGKGNVAELEPGHLLFWATSGDGAASIPGTLARKRLSSASIVPYLRRYPAPSSLRSDVPWHLSVRPLVDSVSRENLEAIIQALQDFGTRYTGTPGGRAALDFVAGYFRRLGYPVSEVPFTGGGAVGTVCAELAGRSFPDDLVILCAHADSTSPTPETSAPGADDNASGTAAVMEAARLLSGRPFESTVLFAVFSGEEQGLDGSRAFVSRLRLAGRRVVGVVNLDMIAFADRAPEDLAIFVNAPSEWMGRRIALDAAEFAGLSVNSRVDPSAVYSDHASFWDVGFAALLAIEDAPLNNPHYHTTGDTLDTLDLGFCARATKAALATTAVLAQPVSLGPAPPRALTARSSFFSALLGTRKSVYLRWEKAAEVSGYNVYRTEIPHGFYERVNPEPVRSDHFVDTGVPSGRVFYYAVTAVDAAGLEGNLSLEIEVPAVPPEGS